MLRGQRMAVQTVFKRYELKYLITAEQKQKIIAAIAPYMELDGYGRSSIRNIYYDTDSYLLIRRSIEKPVSKKSSVSAVTAGQALTKRYTSN